MPDFRNAKKWLEDKEKLLAKSVLKWKLSKDGVPLPDERTLDSGAEEVVREANRIITERGRDILKEVGSGFKGFLKGEKK